MIQLNVYPGGKKRIVTFSYDDGSQNDARLIDLFNKYGVKGTFHLNAGRYAHASEADLLAIRKLYTGHEIACHTVQHGWLSQMTHTSMIREVFDDRAVIEKIAGHPVVGMSYPSGDFNADVIAVLAACDIRYCRTTLDTNRMKLPDNFLAWHPTCHHRNALPLVEGFMSDLDSQWRTPLFYIWGHSHEFRTEEDWAYIEKVVSGLAGSDKIWYATNIEICDYITAAHQLRISADETMVFNPTATDIWIEKDKKTVCRIPAGQTVTLA